jgi:hypothetical protein
MPSLAEQVVAAVTTALTGAVPAVGSRVFRSREDALVRGEMPALVVRTVSDNAETVSLDLAISRVQLELAVEVHVQAGEPWETAADAVATAAHTVVLGLALPGQARVVSMFQLDEAVSGDASPGMRSLNYAIEFFRSTAALDAAP